MSSQDSRIVIEIQKAGQINKGAYLMLLAVVNQIKLNYPKAIITMETTGPQGDQPYKLLLSLGVYPKAYLKILARDLSWLFNLIPKKILDRYGLIREKDINVIIDAAGFAYSDQWGKKPIDILWSKIKRCKKNGTKFIFLPQAFGPFREGRSAKKMKASLYSADLVIARDQISFASLNDLSASSGNIDLYPDFTNLLEGQLPSYFNPNIYQSCIVPNMRMIDKAGSSENNYIEFMSFIVNYLAKLGRQPFILIHESKDAELAAKLCHFDKTIPVIQENNPLKIKGIIGSSKILIGSRFHSLVSGLSQGIPTLGTGWSHKYQELFNDYGFSQGLLSLSLGHDEVRRSIDVVCDPQKAKEISNQLGSYSLAQKKLSLEMWSKVHTVITSSYD